MLSLIKVKFKTIDYHKDISFIKFVDNKNKEYSTSLRENELFKLQNTLDKIKNDKDYFYIAYHDDMNNIPFIIFNKKIYDFSADSIYSLKDINSQYILKSLSFSFLFMILALIITIPLTLLFTLIPFLESSFLQILIVWEISLGGFCFYCLKKYFTHYSFVKKSLTKIINVVEQKNINYFECDF